MKKIIVLISLFFCCDAIAAVISPLQVVSTTRIMHPDYQSENLGSSGSHNYHVFNRDNTRIKMWENAITGDTPNIGREMVWATISDIQAGWTDLTDYRNKAKVVPGLYAGTPPTHTKYRTITNCAVWSNIVGEENIIYALIESGPNADWLVKINVDTETVIQWVSIGTMVNSEVYGYRRDNGKLQMSLDQDNWNSSGGYEIDLVTQTKTFVASKPSQCTAEWQQWSNVGSHGHSGKSPSGQYFVDSDSGCVKVLVTDLDTCVIDQDLAADVGTVHFSWDYDETWFLTNSGGDNRCGQTPAAPSLEPYTISQVIYDPAGSGTFTYYPLVTQDTAFRWTGHTNFQAHFLKKMSHNGQYAVFQSTNGKYSYEDNQNAGSTPWDTVGLYLIEFEMESSEESPRTKATGGVTISAGATFH